MSGARNTEQESLQEKEARLQRELEELEAAERIRDLERRIEEARRRAQLPSEPGTDNLPTRHHQAQASAPAPAPPSPCRDLAERAGSPERQVEISHETTQQASHSPEIRPNPIHSKAGLGSSPTHDRDIHASTRIVPPPSLAPAIVVPSPGSYDVTQPRPTPPASLRSASNTISHLLIPRDPGTNVDPEAVTTLQYYDELDDSGDDSAELLFYDMDLEQLYGYASTLEENIENDVGQGMQLSRVFCFIFSRTGVVDDIQKAIDRAEEALTATHIDDPNYALFLKNLIVMLMKKYEGTRSLEDLDRAILRAEEMVTLTPPFHPDRPYRWIGLTVMKFKKAAQTRSAENFDEAMLMATEAASIMEEARVDHLGKFERTGNLNDLQMAIARGEEAAAATPHNHPDKASKLLKLSKCLFIMFQQTGNINDLQTAAARCKEAAAAAPYNHPNRANILKLLVYFSKVIFYQTDDLDYLQTAIAGGEEAIAVVPHDNPDKPKLLCDLAASLRTRFEQIGNIDDLQISIQKIEEAIAVVPYDNPDKPKLLGDLAVFLGIRFEQIGNLDDLQMAIQKSEEAIATTPRDHPERWNRLANLAALLGVKAKQTIDPNDLQIAIQTCEATIEAIPRNHPSRESLLINLANFFGLKFDHKGEEAIKMAPRDCLNKGRMLGNIAVSFQSRFKRTGNLNDLQIAIQRGEDAIKAMPRGHLERAAALTNLAGAFQSRFKLTGNLNDLQIAIQNSEEAIEIMPRNYLDRAGPLDNLARSFQARFKQTGNLNDLQIAIQRGEEAIEVAPRGHFRKATTLANLAGAIMARFRQTGNPNDSERAVRLFVEAAELPNARPPIRIQSASNAAKILANNKQWAQVSHITEIAVNLLPTVAPRQLGQHDQQHMLGQFDGLAALAASAALEAGKDASHAVQLLELGRSIIIGLRLGTRSDLTELRKQHKEMAEKFEQLRDILDSPSSSMLDFATGGPLASVSNTNQRHNASFELDEIVGQIRRLPGFENFLLPPQAHELQAAASLGPIVLINVSKYRCDALLVETQAIRSIRLPDLHQADIEKEVKLMRSARSGPTSSPDARDQMSRMLEWLWNVAVRPILDELRFVEPPSDDNWPRIWWIPTGPLSLLPLHAAGRPFPQSTESALDRVVSSYSPSIKALLYARRNSQKNLNFESGEALLVSMGTTPRYSDLLFAKEEVNKLANLLPGSVRRVTLERPCRKDVLASLDTCTMFHFAGHGESHPSDPSKSSLLLRDWEKDPLTVEHLIGLDLSRKSPWLAYLSACSTGESRAKNLYDEAINLVSVCQLAGFQHVVGSLWEVSDRYSVDAAEEVYKTIREGGTFDGERIAWGVHRAARLLRDTTSQRCEVRSAEAPVSEEENIVEARTGSKRVARPWVVEAGTGSKRVARPWGYERCKEESKEERSDPLVWAAYIHAGS